MKKKKKKENYLAYRSDCLTIKKNKNFFTVFNYLIFDISEFSKSFEILFKIKKI